MITTLTQADGSDWAYQYDGRDRLTKAERDNDGDTITATYEYTYDDGDNLITKVEPFFDDFNDTDYAGWSSSSSWSVSNGYMERSSGTTGFYRSNTDADLELWFSYCNGDTSSNDYASSTYIRNASPDYVRVWIAPDRMRLLQKSGGDYTTLATNTSATTTEDVWYDVHVVCDDSDITVWRGQRGGAMSQVLSTSSATVTTTDYLMFVPVEDSTYRYDDIRLVSDDLSTTTTFAYDDANELTSMTNNGTVNFAYDDWGRTISKWQGDFDASYAYRYGDKLYSITSDFNGEGTVTYQYGADGKRRQRTANSVTTKYRWDAGWNMINEENVLDVLTMTYIADGGVLAEITGTVPSSGTARYYCHDNLGSTRRLRAADKSSSGQYEFTPYGAPYTEAGVALSALGGAFTGKPWDAPAHVYYFPYRYFSACVSRWTTRDPLHMPRRPNRYAYVGGNPTNRVDPLGLVDVRTQRYKETGRRSSWWCHPCRQKKKESHSLALNDCLDCCERMIEDYKGSYNLTQTEVVKMHTVQTCCHMLCHGLAGGPGSADWVKGMRDKYRSIRNLETCGKSGKKYFKLCVKVFGPKDAKKKKWWQIWK